MNEALLDLICEKKIFATISGITRPGTELSLVKSRDVLGGYIQKDCIFTASMVKTILFHELGATITLKS